MERHAFADPQAKSGVEVRRLSVASDPWATAVSTFGAPITAKLAGGATSGAPEDQLRAPLERLIADLAPALQLPASDVVLKGESSLADLKVRPDYAVEQRNALGGVDCVRRPAGVRAQGRPTAARSAGNRLLHYRGGLPERPRFPENASRPAPRLRRDLGHRRLARGPPAADFHPRVPERAAARMHRLGSPARGGPARRESASALSGTSCGAA